MNSINRKNLVFFSLLAIILLLCAATARAIPVFPGALGAGADSFGGSGRNLTPPRTTVFKVGSLKDKGPLTLRECVEADAPRVCVFQISGVITLKKNLVVKNPYLTIAGQTAPQPGIRLRGAGLIIEADNVLVQHIEIRVGDSADGPNPDGRDGLRLGGEHKAVSKVYIDHVSVSWALDENVSTSGALSDSTIANLLIAEGLDNSIHPKGPHSKALFISSQTRNLSILNNMLAHHGERNPHIKPGASVQFLNNLVYGWEGKSKTALLNLSDVNGLDLPTFLDFSGNSYVQTYYSAAHAAVYGHPLNANSKIFAGENIAPTRRTPQGDPWDAVDLPKASYQTLIPNFPSTGSLSIDPVSAVKAVLINAGSRPRQRNETDARIIDEFKNSRGDIKDCIQGCTRAVGNWPKEETRYRQLSLPDHPNEIAGKSGYTKLEQWLFTAAKEVS